MKKLLMIVAVTLAAISAKAAVVNWAVSGAAAQENYKVYLLTSIADSYSSVDDIAAAAVSQGTVAKSGRTYTTGNVVASGDAVTKSATYYFAIVSSDSATSFNYVEATGLAAKVYDPDNQESSPGAFNTISAAAIAAGTSKAIGGSVPEPTTGLLVLLGVAGLVLKRKVA